MNGSVKSEAEQDSQKFYDLFTSQTVQGQSHGGIELFMRTLEHEGPPISSGMNTTPSSSTALVPVGGLGPSMQQQQPLPHDLQQPPPHPNVVLQSLGMNLTEAEEGPAGGQAVGARPHVCQVCRASYKTRTHLRRHMFVHLNNRPYPCTECGKGFNRKEHLTKHIEAVHSGTKYKCQFCGKEISRKDHLSRHIKNMHPLFCGNLKEEGNDPSLLKVQLPCGAGPKQKAQLSFLTPSFPPVSMGQMLVTPILNGKLGKSKGQSQNQNLQNQQPTNSNQSVSFENNALALVPVGSSSNVPGQSGSPNGVNLNSNNNNGSGGNSEPVKGLKSQNSNSVNNQNGLMGLTNLSLTLGGQIRESPFANCGEKKMIVQVFSCTECSASFPAEKDLTAHARSHKPQNFRCTECPRAYTRREKLTEHIRCFHQGQKFKCEFCDKALSRKDHVLRHVRSIHPEVLASRFTAQLQEGGGNDTLGHNPSITSNGSTSSAMNEMGVLLRSVCHVCLKVFGTSYHLGRHIESCHNGDIRPYGCTECGKGFKRKDHLTKHMKAHCPSIREGRQNGLGHTKASRRSKAKAGGANNSSSRNTKGELQNGSSVLVENYGNENNVENRLVVREKSEDPTDFNLAMINSFIAENVNVVVEEGDLPPLLQNPGASPSGKLNCHREKSNGMIGGNTTSSSNTVLINRILSFPCGHCQREYPTRKELLEHLQEHNNEEITQQDHNEREETHQELQSMDFSRF